MWEGGACSPRRVGSLPCRNTCCTQLLHRSRGLPTIISWGEQGKISCNTVSAWGGSHCGPLLMGAHLAGPRGLVPVLKCCGLELKDCPFILCEQESGRVMRTGALLICYNSVKQEVNLCAREDTKAGFGETDIHCTPMHSRHAANALCTHTHTHHTGGRGRHVT